MPTCSLSSSARMAGPPRQRRNKYKSPAHRPGPRGFAKVNQR
jgi:hypothetical protein